MPSSWGRVLIFQHGPQRSDTSVTVQHQVHSSRHCWPHRRAHTSARSYSPGCNDLWHPSVRHNQRTIGQITTIHYNCPLRISPQRLLSLRIIICRQKRVKLSRSVRKSWTKSVIVCKIAISHDEIWNYQAMYGNPRQATVSYASFPTIWNEIYIYFHYNYFLNPFLDYHFTLHYHCWIKFILINIFKWS